VNLINALIDFDNDSKMLTEPAIVPNASANEDGPKEWTENKSNADPDDYRLDLLS